jgi:hypothetical protein
MHWWEGKLGAAGIGPATFPTRLTGLWLIVDDAGIEPATSPM